MSVHDHTSVGMVESEKTMTGPPRPRRPSTGHHSRLTIQRTRSGEIMNEHATQRANSKAEIDPDVRIIDWDGPDDPDMPFNWTKRRKVTMTTVALVGTLLIQINGTSITTAATNINDSFGISDATFPNSYWPVTSWTLGGAIFTMIILPVMEDLGLRTSYLITYGVFILFVIPQAVAKNFATEIVTRFFAGGCVTTLANCICGLICDVWEGDEGRATPMAVFITVYLGGASFGPVFGAAILEFLPWRWIVYIQLIIYGLFYPVFFFTFHETRGPVILRQRAKRIRSQTGEKAYTNDELHGPSLLTILIVSIKRPFSMFFTEYVVFSFTLWSAFTVGLVYSFTQSTAQVFGTLYGWPAYSTGYIQAAIVVGEILGYFVWLFSQKRLYFASASRNTENPGVPIPEARLYCAIPGAFLGMTGGMFVYAWTSYSFLPWIAPAIGLAMVGCGINVVVIAIAEYVTDCYSMYASSAVAAVACGEGIFSAFLPLAAQSMYTNLGFNWASSLFAFLAMVLGLAPVILLIGGKSIRAKSPFMNEAQYATKRSSEEELQPIP